MHSDVPSPQGGHRADPCPWHAVSHTLGSSSPPLLAHSAPSSKLPPLQQPGLLAMPQLKTKRVPGSADSPIREQLRTLAGVTTVPPEEEMQMGDRGVMALHFGVLSPSQKGVSEL